MGKMVYSSTLLKRGDDRKKYGIAKGEHLRTHYKNMRETAAAVSGMSAAKAVRYLKDVEEHKQCVPFRRHNGGVGRTAQAKAFKATQGRWPAKSAKFLLNLLVNAQSNAVANELELEDLVVKQIIVQQAPHTHRRTYRAHGRINPYKGSPSHIELILSPKGAEVPKAKESSALARQASDDGQIHELE